MWRYIKDKKYGGYAIQKQKSFLFWKWWSNQYLSKTKIYAEKLVKMRNNPLMVSD